MLRDEPGSGPLAQLQICWACARAGLGRFNSHTPLPFQLFKRLQSPLKSLVLSPESRHSYHSSAYKISFCYLSVQLYVFTALPASKLGQEIFKSKNIVLRQVWHCSCI